MHSVTIPFPDDFSADEIRDAVRIIVNDEWYSSWQCTHTWNESGITVTMGWRGDGETAAYIADIHAQMDAWAEKYTAWLREG